MYDPNSQVQSSNEQELFDVRLESVRYGAREINLYEFRRVDGRPLPAFSAGAHIDVHLPKGHLRQYSLVDAGGPSGSYLIGVKRESGGRGGSVSLHDEVRVGSTLRIGAPRNNFPLNENAEHSVLVAGGIGITPIFTMWRKLVSIGRSVELVYSCRSRLDAVFLESITAGVGHHLHFDDENNGSFLDIAAVVGRAPRNAHLYCCGPGPMLKAFEQATSGWPADQVHVEYFSTQSEKATEGAFVVELSRSGMTIAVEQGQTILQALIAAGVDAPYSCEEGVCGACMTNVIDGVPDHRDSVMTPSERQANKKIMICCSGSKTPRLVLDL